MNGHHVHELDTPVSEMNPGIRRTVQWLRDNGFATCDSGDGVTHEFACDRPVAYVCIRVEPAQLAAEAHRLLELLSANGVDLHKAHEAMMDAWENEADDATMMSFACLECTYNPVDGVAILDLTNVADAQLFKDQPS